MIDVSPDVLEWLAVGSLLTLAGALIKFRGWTFLLAGYDETTAVPDDVVQDIAGNTIIGGTGAIPRPSGRGYAPSLYHADYQLHHGWIFHRT